MKSKLSQMLLVVTLIAVSLLCWNVYAQEKKSSKVVWEYRIFSSIGDNAAQLSQLGVQGWELTSVRTEEEMLGNVRQIRVYYYLKHAQQVQP